MEDNRIIKSESMLPAMNIDPAQKDMIRIALMPSISTYSPKEATNNILAIVAYAVTISGQKITTPEMMVFADEILERCTNLYPHVTIEEIRVAIKNGIYNEYGEYFGLNARTFMFFIEGYLQSEKRRIAKEAYEQAKKVEQKAPVKMTIGDYKKWILEDYRIFREMGKEFVPFIARKYVLLRRFGLIGLKSLESWDMWLLRSKNEKVWRETQGAKKKGDKGALSEIYKIYSNFEENNELPVSEYKRIVNNARRMRYFRFFELMAEKGVDNFFTDQITNDGKEDNPATGGTGSDTER
jgi:hypothetical protein